MILTFSQCVWTIDINQNVDKYDVKTQLITVNISTNTNGGTQSFPSYLDIHPEINNGSRGRLKSTNKDDDFIFPIMDFPFINSNFPADPKYGVDILQPIRYFYCVDVSDVRQTFYNVNNLYDLFTNASGDTILKFVKEINLYTSMEGLIQNGQPRDAGKKKTHRKLKIWATNRGWI